MNRSIPVTVLMPVYNCAKYVAEAVESVLQQTFVNFELVIVNDGSTDNSEAVIRSFTDPRIRIINQPNGGVSAALNTGLRHASGTYVARFDADDVCYPGRLQEQLDFMTSNPDYVMVGSDAHYMTEEGEIIHLFRNVAHEDADLRQSLRTQCSFIHSSVMYRLADVVALGGYEVRAHTFEDYFLWQRLIGLGKVCNLKSPLIKVRFNVSSVTVDEKDQDKEFLRLKRKALDTGVITEDEGQRIIQALRKLSPRRKYASYHRLLGKKFLWNNFQPQRARKHLAKAIVSEPLSYSSYFLYAFSLLPYSIIKRVYSAKKGTER